MKALVVGGTGPTGPAVVEGLLKRGYKVTILHRGSHEIELPSSVEHLHGDPHFVETLEQALGRRTFDLAIGMYGRLRFVAQVLRGRTPRFICISGLSYRSFFEVMGNTPFAPVPVPETAPLCTDDSISHFGHLMAASEQAVVEAHQQGSYSATLFRYPGIYGPRQVSPREWSLIRRFLEGRKRLIIPDGGLVLETRGYIENMAHAVLLAVDSPQQSSGEIFNVGDETVLSLREWVIMVGEILNHEWELVSLPAELATVSLPYARQFYHRVLDTTKSKAQLGYRDVVPAAEAIRRTIEHYLQNPLPKGGEHETFLNDSFDYAKEDRIIDKYRAALGRLDKIAHVDYRFRHGYPHPKKPSNIQAPEKEQGQAPSA